MSRENLSAGLGQQKLFQIAENVDLETILKQIINLNKYNNCVFSYSNHVQIIHTAFHFQRFHLKSFQ